MKTLALLRVVFNFENQSIELPELSREQLEVFFNPKAVSKEKKPLLRMDFDERDPAFFESLSSEREFQMHEIDFHFSFHIHTLSYGKLRHLKSTINKYSDFLLEYLSMDINIKILVHSPNSEIITTLQLNDIDQLLVETEVIHDFANEILIINKPIFIYHTGNFLEAILKNLLFRANADFQFNTVQFKTICEPDALYDVVKVLNEVAPHIKQFNFQIEVDTYDMNRTLLWIYSILKNLNASIAYQFSLITSIGILSHTSSKPPLPKNENSALIASRSFMSNIRFSKNRANYSYLYNMLTPCLPLLFISKKGFFIEQVDLPKQIVKDIFLLAVLPHVRPFALTEKFLSHVVDVILYAIENAGTEKMRALDIRVRPNLLFSIFNKGYLAIKSSDDKNTSAEFTASNTAEEFPILKKAS